jgi:hypothetical protein
MIVNNMWLSNYTHDVKIDVGHDGRNAIHDSRYVGW